MRTDQHGRIILDELDLCDLYMQDPDRTILNALVEQPIEFNPDLELSTVPELLQWHDDPTPTEKWDAQNQDQWHMPQEYAQFDIAQWVLEQCSSDAELQRAGAELLEYAERDGFNMLRYMKYLVDTMRKHNIVWGVGRGSSVASFVLYLIGVHKINSLKYDLSLDEFLK